MGAGVSRLAPEEKYYLGKVVDLGRDWAEKGENKGSEKKGQERGNGITGCVDECLMLLGGVCKAAVCCSLQQEQNKKPDLLPDHQLSGLCPWSGRPVRWSSSLEVR